MDKIPAAVVILIGTFIVSVVAGFNDELGKFLFAFMLIVAFIWLAGQGTQTHVASWEKIASATNVGVTLV